MNPRNGYETADAATQNYKPVEKEFKSKQPSDFARDANHRGFNVNHQQMLFGSNAGEYVTNPVGRKRLGVHAMYDDVIDRAVRWQTQIKTQPDVSLEEEEVVQENLKTSMSGEVEPLPHLIP